MRIAFFLGSFPLISETFILRQITGLIDLGHEVDIYAETRPPEDAVVHPTVAQYQLLEKTTYLSDHIPEASNYWELPVWPVDGETWLPGAEQAIPNALRVKESAPHLIRCLTLAPELTFTLLDPAEYGYMARSLSAVYRLSVLSSLKKQYDIVHVHFGPIANKYRFIKQFWKVPLIVSFHGYDFTTFPRQHGLDIYSGLFATADLVTVNSEYTKNRVQELGCPADKIEQLSVGLPMDEFRFQTRTLHLGGKVNILTVARLVEIKGHEYFINALSKMLNRRPDIEFHYHIVGDGPLRRKLEDLVTELKIARYVTFYGAMDSNEIKQKMTECHVFALTSRSVQGDEEGQGLVLQEAQATGLPVIATNHGAFPEGLLPGLSGILVPEDDVDEVAEQLLHVITHPELWPTMGTNGRSFVERKYDIKALNLELIGLYIKAINENN